MSILFGPIYSRRFGKSLGIDLSPHTKQCNYDCLYCELTPAKTVDHQEEVLPLEEVVSAVKDGIDRHPDIDVLTLTANGEPTLYPHLDALVERINSFKQDIRTLILSNGSTIADPAIQRTLHRIDTVKLSLDCATPRCFKRLDRPAPGIELESILSGMLAFRAQGHTPLIIEILVVAGINDKPAEITALNDYLLRLRPDRIDLGTIDRPPAYEVPPVTYDRLYTIARQFDPDLPVHITHRKQADAVPESYSKEAILATLAKRPLTPDDITILFDRESQERLEKMVEEGQIVSLNNNGVIFFKIRPKNH